jgi:signal transduction histidine kinase
MHFTTEPKDKPGLPLFTTVVCLVCVLILVINGWSLFHNLSSLKGANSVQSQTARVSDKMQYLNVLIMDAESSLRGYFLSGSEVYLGPLRTATTEIDIQFRELDTLLADNPSQRRNLAQLRSLVYRKLDNMNQTLEVYRKGGLEDIVKIAAFSDSKSMLDEIRLQVVIMVQEQNELLHSRSGSFYQQYQNAVILGIGINAGAILVLALFYRLIRRGFYARQATQRALEHANENLESMVTVRTEQLSVLSRHLISVSEEEKARLARELHDELGANLTAINIDLNAVADRLRPEHPALAGMLERARGTLVNTVELKRRIVENLRPSLLDNLGLSAAVQSYCDEFATVTGLNCEALIDDEVDVAGPMQSIAVFRIVQESLNNIAKYAKARHVIVQLARENGGLALEVIDDGVGIDLDAAAKPKSHGLLGMRERALLLGGSLRISRGVNDVGTCVEAFIPVAGPDAGSLSAPVAHVAAPVPTKERPGIAVETASGPGVPAVSGSVPGSYRDPSSSVSNMKLMTCANFSVPRPSAGGHTPSLQPCSIHPHILQDLDGR